MTFIHCKISKWWLRARIVTVSMLVEHQAARPGIVLQIDVKSDPMLKYVCSYSNIVNICSSYFYLYIY